MTDLSIDNYWSPDGPEVILLISHEPSYRQLPLAEIGQAAATHAREWMSLYGHGVNLPPAFFADFGTITMAKPWGGRVEISSEGRPFIHPAAQSLEEALEIEPVENPDLAESLALFETVREAPDFQGVLNTAALVLDQEALLSGMIEEPELVHRFLDRVCEVNLKFMTRLQAAAGRTDGNIWPYIWLPAQFGVGITEDMMPLLGVDAYREFGVPYLKRIANAFNGVFIHCCGEWARHAPTLAGSGITIRGVEFHHPFTRFDDLRHTLPGAVVVPFYAAFKSNEFPDQPAFVRDLLTRREKGQRLAIATTDADPALPAVREWVLSFGGVVPDRLV